MSELIDWLLSDGPDYLDTWVFVVAGMAAAVLFVAKAAGVVWKFLKGVHRLYTVGARTVETQAELIEYGPVITGMASQFANNGGSSLRDVVDAIVGSLDALGSKQDTNHANAEKHWTDLEKKVETTVEGLVSHLKSLDESKASTDLAVATLRAEVNHELEQQAERTKRLLEIVADMAGRDPREEVA